MAFDEVIRAENERTSREWERFPPWQQMDDGQKLQAERLAERQGRRFVAKLNEIRYHLSHG